jgi:hypothetical protein
VSGRWDNTLVVIDLAKAIEPANDGTPNAIVNRVRVTPDLAPNTPASGQPVNVVLSPDKRFAYIVNHSGAVTTKAAADFQHGHAGTITVVNVAKALDPANNMTLNAVEAIIPTGNFGPVASRSRPTGSTRWSQVPKVTATKMADESSPSSTSRPGRRCTIWSSRGASRASRVRRSPLRTPGRTRASVATRTPTAS